MMPQQWHGTLISDKQQRLRLYLFEPYSFAIKPEKQKRERNFCMPFFSFRKTKKSLNKVVMMMKKQSWVCTFVTQVLLCLALYIVFKIGQPQNPVIHRNGNGRIPLDMYFISVVGGFRPLQEQTLLLKMMEKVMKTYNVVFVINISELGGDDPLVKNASSYFQSLEIPWYMTRSLKGQGAGYYHKNINMPFGRTVDVIVVDTGLFEDPSFVAGNNQLQWLEKTLKDSSSDWRIIVGYHSLINCLANNEQALESATEPLHRILLNYGVDAYLSGQACPTYLPKEGPSKNSSGVLENKGPYLTSINKKLRQIRENIHGFLLHRVSSLEFVSHFVTLKGDVTRSIALLPRGREFM